ncbi:Arc family DNA-binding protein [Pseudomonas sp. SP16.1]|uniref:Arc family DNA-binding protein n=1 Tax=Pseudomonas sp. SP16.1 TaxID=3458854 RepID=UPI004046704E
MGNSRTADKFVVRMPDGVRARVDAAAQLDHTSMNTFVVQAIEEKLARAKRQELLLDALEQAASGIHSARVQAAPRLIGWRTADYLEETNDHKVASNWAPNVAVLPIFEGDTITKLPNVPVEVSPC